MGMYIYVTKEDLVRMKEVKSDQDLNEIFQEALKYRPDLLIEEREYYISKGNVFNRKKVKQFIYNLCFEENAWDGSAYQAMIVYSAGTNKPMVSAFLYGVVNAGLWFDKEKNDCVKENCKLKRSL